MRSRDCLRAAPTLSRPGAPPRGALDPLADQPDRQWRDVAFSLDRPDQLTGFGVRMARPATAAVAPGPAWADVANRHGDRHLAEDTIGKLPARPRRTGHPSRPVGSGHP